MFVTSAPEVRLPSVADFIVMLLNESFRDPDLPRSHTGILRQFDCRFQPEFRLTTLTVHMNVHSCFLAGEKIEAEPSRSKNCRAQQCPLSMFSVYGSVVTRPGSRVAEL
jgi:hypothetical protein